MSADLRPHGCDGSQRVVLKQAVALHRSLKDGDQCWSLDAGCDVLG